MKSSVFLWGIFLFVLAFFFVYSNNVGITGNIPLTGVLKEETGQSVELQEYDILFSLEEDLVNKLRDLSFSMKFSPKLQGRSSVDLDYMVFDLNGELIYFDEETLIVDGETTIERDLDTYEAQQVQLEDGNYSFVVRVSYGEVDQRFSQNFEFKEISEFLYSLKQLFDISIQLDSRVIDSPDELGARVIFESFGEEPTPVNLTFFIYDAGNNEIYRDDVSTVVETEKVLFVDFEGFEAPPGEYLLVMRSFYNVGVEDYFEQSFEIREQSSVWPFVLAGIVLGIGGYLIYRESKKKR